MEYEKNSFDSPETHRTTLNGKSFTTISNQYQSKPEKLKNKVDSNIKIPEKTKC
jgi:hypothetical protein